MADIAERGARLCNGFDQSDNGSSLLKAVYIIIMFVKCNINGLLAALDHNGC